MRRAGALVVILLGAMAWSQAPDLASAGSAYSPAASIVVDAIRAAAKSDIAVQAAGFFADGKLPAKVDADALNKMLSYPGEEITVLTLTGDQVKKAMERSLSLLPQSNRQFLQVSGMTVTYSASAPVQSRVKKILVDGAPLSDTAKYTVAMPATLARGALGYFTIWKKEQITSQTGVTVEAAVREYLKGKSSWPIGETNRIVGE
jgi:2',3'-cyclic-nucleotide 2'-phosphodiesterase (5'-nucleotidase family)